MVWSRPTLTGKLPSSRHGHAAMALGGADHEIMTFGGFSRRGYERDVHVLQVGVGNARHYHSQKARLK